MRILRPTVLGRHIGLLLWPLAGCRSIRKLWSCTVGGRQAVARITGDPVENSVVDLVALARGITGNQVLAMNRGVSAAVADLLSLPYIWETIVTIATQLLNDGFMLNETVITIVEASGENIVEGMKTSKALCSYRR